MSGGALLSLAVMAALWPPWPFGRGDNDDGPATIEALDSAGVAVDTSATITAGEAKAMQSYREFLELAADDPELSAEAMRRLADLQLETGEAVELERADAARGVGLGETIDLYTALLESYPDYDKRDLVLYQLARAYEAAGRPEPALRVLDRLVAEHPDSSRVNEAQFRRGETLFVDGRYTEAEAAYSAVLAGGAGNTNFGEQAQYKLGWSLFKQSRYDASFEPFFALLDGKLASPDGAAPAELYAAMGRADQELVDDTLRVLSISFSYLDGADAVTEHFGEHGARPYSYIVYSQLGDLYLEQERYQDAADAYHAFIELDAWHAVAPLLQAEVVDAYEAGGFADLVLEAKRDFVNAYGAGSPYWERYTFAGQPDVAAELERNLTDLAAFHHAEAQAGGGAEHYRQAARWYRSYLDSFPNRAQAAETNFLLAEVLFESGDYASAAREYERTAYAYPVNEASAEAGYAALLAYDEHEAGLAGEARATWHRRAVDSALRFASTYPEHEQAAAVQTDAAEKLFALEELATARDVARDVVERMPQATRELERTAWTVIAHSEFDLGAYAAAESAYSTLRAYVAPDEPARAEIEERIAASIYRRGEQAREAGDTLAAVDHFLRVGQAAPGASIRATAEYDAAAALIGLEDWQRAAGVLERFRAAYPEHELVGDVTASLAVAYVETGDTLAAAREFERIGGGDGDADVRREALWRAAELYDEAQSVAAAREAYAAIVERHPAPLAEAVEARQRLADLAREAGDGAARRRWLEAIVAADAAAGAERTDRTRSLAARAQLEIASRARDAFAAARLVIPLERSLEIKRERMETALDAYGKAADYGIADVTTAATYEIAELYNGLARALFDSERPGDLTEDELAQYDILLEEQAFPFEEEAISVHEVNAARTQEGIYDEWVVKSLDALAGLVPVRYAKTEIGERYVATLD